MRRFIKSVGLATLGRNSHSEDRLSGSERSRKGFPRKLRAVVKAASFLCAAALCSLAAPDTSFAYIGPGAGFAFLGSTFVFVLTLLTGFITLMLWPLRMVWRKARGLGISKRARCRRVVVLGLDGLEPSLVEQYMREGRLPNMKSLMEEGAFERLGTTLPALSPVAWSSFQTGVNPGAHNIFDFLTRDKRTCLPEMSSTETVAGRYRKIGPFKIPVSRAKVQISRKSKPFWKVLGEHGVFSSIIRVPISYPAEPFGGSILSAMCTPDLRGSQGTFSYYTTRSAENMTVTGGEVLEFKKEFQSRNGSGSVVVLHGTVSGPPDPRGDGKTALKVPFTLVPHTDTAELTIGEEERLLRVNEFSDWVRITFRFGRKKIHGIARFCLRECGSEVSLYLSPVNVDPERPVLPIASPIFFSSWLAKRNGLYGTLGLMEDTWGRNELALDDERFLAQTYATHAEREKMFLDTLERTREGVCVCVFDASDRIQHMFWRYMDPAHPSPREGDQFARVIPEMYERMDALVGTVRSRLKDGDVLFVISDHGFSSFRRCVNLNAWLKAEGYLVLKPGKEVGGDYLVDVDWSKTKAFAVGLAGLYINKKGREWQGIVGEEEYEQLKTEIARKLEKLTDTQDGAQAVVKVHDSAKAYRGLYRTEAPDLIVGYAPGYRVSWDSVTGAVESGLFSDNLKAWSGDHHVEPSRIPGILFTNRQLKVEKPHIIDIAPTILDLFAVRKPAYMEGQALL